MLTNKIFNASALIQIALLSLINISAQFETS